jgi:hypothetical protein
MVAMNKNYKAQDSFLGRDALKGQLYDDATSKNRNV